MPDGKLQLGVFLLQRFLVFQLPLFLTLLEALFGIPAECLYQQQNQHIGDQRSRQIGDQRIIHLLCGNISIDIAVSPVAVYAVVAAGHPAADIHVGQLLRLIRPSNGLNQLVPHNTHAVHLGCIGSLHTVFLNQ